MPAHSVSPVSSIAEALDRWRGGDRVEVLRSEFLDVLASVPDPRDPRGRRYPLDGLLAIAILATAAGMRGYAGFATWARTAPEEVLAGLGVRFRRPSEKTFRSVLSCLDAADLDRRLGAYFMALAAEQAAAAGEPLAVALDGKSLRGARRAGAAAAHLVSVFAHRARLAKLERAKPDFRVKSGCCGWSAVGVRRPNVLCRQGYRGHCGRCGMPRAVVAR